MVRTAVHLLLIAGICVGILGDSAAQEAGRTLLATVVDAGGRSMVDFSADDFVISEGSQSRDVLDVHIADYPVAVLVDDTADPATWALLKGAVTRFIIRIGERPVAVALLSDPDHVVASLDNDRATLLARINALSPAPAAQLATLPVVARVSQLLKATESPFSAIVIVATHAVDATEMVRGSLLPVILDSGAAVHVVEGRSASVEQIPVATSDLLRVLAEQTHGQYTTIFAQSSYAIALDRLADRLSSEMMVQYLVPPGERAGDVRVGVRRPGARVRGLGVSK